MHRNHYGKVNKLINCKKIFLLFTSDEVDFILRPFLFYETCVFKRKKLPCCQVDLFQIKNILSW